MVRFRFSLFFTILGCSQSSLVVHFTNVRGSLVVQSSVAVPVRGSLIVQGSLAVHVHNGLICFSGCLRFYDYVRGFGCTLFFYCYPMFFCTV